MLRVRDVLLVLVGVVVSGTAAHADMMPVSNEDIGCKQLKFARGQVETQPQHSTFLSDCWSIADLDVEAIRFVPDVGEDFAQTLNTQPAQIIAEGQSSVRLCLSALVGLGLCSCAHCLKNVRFGFIPEWYHNGGPFQVAHSLAVDPDSVCPAPARCFVQPAWVIESRIPQYCLGAILSLWRHSQYTPDVLASRGPPAIS